jgi:dTDP-4-dehydrorhamnose reductase
MRILLLGAGGQLGQEIIARAGELEIEVAARSRAQTDITEAGMVEAAVRQTRPDIVVNAGAYTKVDKAESEPDQAFRVNATGPGVIAAACAIAGVPLIHISTDYVFDGTKSSPYVESDSTAPLGVYGASKLAGEEAVRGCHKKHLILRTSWVYGKYGANFLKTMLRLAGERSELKIVADQYGSPTSTADLAEVIFKLAPKLVAGGERTNWGTYHFTGDGETNWCQFADEILRRREKWVGSRPTLTPITSAEYPTPARRPSNSVLSNDLFKTTFRLSARPWQQSVSDVVDALTRNNRT